MTKNIGVFDSQIFQSYWFSTGTPTFLVNYLKDAHYFIPDLDGHVVLDEEGLQTYRAIAQEPFPILFQSGYLIFEFKLSGSGTAEDAIDQIRKNNYAAPYKAGEKKIVLIGSSFDKKARTIQEWVVDNS